MIACDMGAMLGMSWWMWLPGLVVFLALFAFGIWAVGRLTHRPSGGALQVLEERLARGEIDADEFRRCRSILAETR